MNRFFAFFEGLIDPFEPESQLQPPPGFFAYVWFYVKRFRFAFLAMLLLGFANAIIEALVFSFVGQIVDVLSVFEPERGQGWAGLWQQSGHLFLYMIGIAIIGRSLVILAGAIVEEQIVVPNFFTRTRWLGHAHIVRQSLEFFQNDLSGRIAQKVFQSGHSMGDMMIAFVQTISFIAAYAVTTFGLLSVLNAQLGLIVAIWLAGFMLIAWRYVPKIREHGRITAEAAAVATGRMVDGYGNISTVKLHGSTARENDWVREGLKAQYEALKLLPVI